MHKLRRLLRWFRSRLYHKLVLSHALLLILFLFLVGMMGSSAFRAFGRLLFEEQFRRQSRLLFGNLKQELDRAHANFRLHQRLHGNEPKLPKALLRQHRKSHKYKTPMEAWLPIVRRHTRTGSQFLVTLIAVRRPSGQCLFEAYPPALMDLLVGRRWPRRRGWKQLIRSPKVVLREAHGGPCYGVKDLEHLRHGQVHGIASFTYKLKGVPKLQIQYHSLSPFRSHAPPAAFLFSMVVIFGFAMILVFPINRTIAKPLQELTQAVDQIRGGELTQEVPPQGTDEVGQLAEAIEEMRRSLHEYQEQRRVLLSNISHEIRTPLARIRTVAESVEDGLMREAEPLTQAMEGICKQVDEIDQLLGDLLDIARFELSKANRLQRAGFDVWKLLREMQRTLRPAAKAQQLRLTLGEAPKQPLWVHGDKRRLRQVLNNLIQNAIRHSPEDGEIHLRAGTRSEEIEGVDAREWVWFEVLDEGPGIPESERERVFERLVRLDPSRSRATGGQGLGLAIVWQIIEAHGGKVGIDDAPGGGARFWVLLPLEPPPPEATPA